MSKIQSLLLERSLACKSKLQQVGVYILVCFCEPQLSLQVRVLNGHLSSIHALAFSPDGKWLASAGEDRVVRVWDLGSARTIKELKGHSDIVYSLVWHQNSKLLASAGMDGAVKLWEVNPQHQHTSLLPNGRC